MTEIDILTQQIAQFLIPFLPYLLKAGKLAGTKAIEQLGEEFTKENIAHAKNLWKKLIRKESVKPAAESVVAQPDNSTAKAAFCEAVTEAIKDDEKLQQEAFQIISKVKVGNILPDGTVTGVSVKNPKRSGSVDSTLETEDVAGKVTGVSYER